MACDFVSQRFHVFLRYWNDFSAKLTEVSALVFEGFESCVVPLDSNAFHLAVHFLCFGDRNFGEIHPRSEVGPEGE